MGDTTIEWTQKTWNPWTGCTKISPGCKNCYMYRDKSRYGQDPSQIVRSRTTFDAPLHWKEPRLVFTCSWSDFFHPEADAWRDDAWAIIKATPRHTYQILTKRPERIDPAFTFPPNVWLGVSVENEKMRSRIHRLREIEATVKFLSLEPVLGEIDLHVHLWKRDFVGMCGGAKAWHTIPTGEIGWVIVGGESGPNCRPPKLVWILSIVKQCQEAGVPVLVKQWGGSKPGLQGLIPDEVWALKQFPKVAKVGE